VPGSRMFYRFSRSGNLGYIGTCDRKRDAMWLSMELHIEYMRSLDDSPRSRAACVTYLQNCIVLFYPERADLISRAQELAGEFGGHLERPTLPRKFGWASGLVGARAAWQMQREFSGFRWWLVGNWDKLLCRLSGAHHEQMSAASGTTNIEVSRERSNQIPMRSAH
jgi:hypothetical protein